MKIITPEEEAALQKRIQNGYHPVRNMLYQLKVGQSLLVENKDWNWRRQTPSAIVRDVERKSKLKFTCYRLLDKSGWVISRTA